jgi:hypothetical protein
MWVMGIGISHTLAMILMLPLKLPCNLESDIKNGKVTIL